MNTKIQNVIRSFSAVNIAPDRKVVLDNLVSFIKGKKAKGETIRLNFICTHNSRRSHLSQIWAQTMAYHFGINDVYCYSGGTEATALFPKVAETLAIQGFDVLKLSETTNPVYAFKYAENEYPIIGFSKEYSHAFNPTGNFAAVVTCNSADEACPVVFGAEARIPIKYDDPKVFDGTLLLDSKYAERSYQIAEEMWYVFSQVLM